MSVALTEDSVRARTETVTALLRAGRHWRGWPAKVHARRGYPDYWPATAQPAPPSVASTESRHSSSKAAASTRVLDLAFPPDECDIPYADRYFAAYRAPSL